MKNKKKHDSKNGKNKKNDVKLKLQLGFKMFFKTD